MTYPNPMEISLFENPNPRKKKPKKDVPLVLLLSWYHKHK